MAIKYFLVLFVPLLMFSCISSSSNIKPRVFNTWTLPTVVDKAQKEIDSGRLSKAAVLLLNAQDESTQKSETLEKLIVKIQASEIQAQTEKRFQDAQDFHSLADLLKDKNHNPELVKMITPSWPPVPLDSKQADTPETWLQGTVTVEVNKGLKVQNGMGMMDGVLGSGFFITQDGYLLTNHHVIESVVDPKYKGYAKLTLRLPNSRGEKLPAKVIAWDVNHDIALLKTEYKPSYVFHFAKDGTLKPGMKVIALGSPAGLEATVTAGIVSATKRQLLPMGNVFQVDAAINHGNSGGPLVNQDGEVMGIAFAGIEQFPGLNFVIPGETIKKILPRLLMGGLAQDPWIGVGLQEDVLGLEVTYVAPEGPADWAGLKVGDRLVGIAGQKITEIAEIQDFLINYGPNCVIPLDITRDNKALRLWTSLDTRPDEPMKKAFETDLIENIMPMAFGMIVENTTTPVDQEFKVIKIYSGSAADQMNLSVGDPVRVTNYLIDKENKIIRVNLHIKKRLAGYFDNDILFPLEFVAREMI